MRLPRPSYANVASTLALVVALSGGAYAASLPKKSVGTPQLKKEAVTTAKVKDGSLTAADFAPGALGSGLSGAVGATGATGPRGPQGPSGLVHSASAPSTVSGMRPCADNDVVTVEVTPDRPSLVFGAATGYWASNEEDPARWYAAQVDVRVDVDGAVARTEIVDTSSPNNERQNIATSGVLLKEDGSPVVLAPGKTYAVRLVVHTYGSCTGTPIARGQLTALLLAA